MGHVTFRYGTMESGKSASLIGYSSACVEQGKPVLILSPSVDARSGIGSVASRSAGKISSVSVSNDADVFDIIRTFLDKAKECGKKGSAYVFIDEAQFFSPEHVREICRASDVFELRVIAYGIRSDFQGKPFPGSAEWMAWADSIEKTESACWFCSRDAEFNLRLDERGKPIFSGEQVLVGSSYKPVCRKCFTAFLEQLQEKE